jgi:hypothetical protein
MQLDRERQNGRWGWAHLPSAVPTRLAASLIVVAAAALPSVLARAADLPARKVATEHVRICSAFGHGFFYIPGSNTCIRIGGRARFEYVAGAYRDRSFDPSSFNATARLIIDTRTATEWGLLRTYTRLDLSRDSGYGGSGTFGSGSAVRGGDAISFGSGGSFPNFAGQDSSGNRLQTGVKIDDAFVQWGGLTAGRTQSFFDFYTDAVSWYGLTNSDVKTQALAYTYTFGSGFSATLAVEDPKERQRNPIAGSSAGAIGGINPTTAIPGFDALYPFALSPFAKYGGANPALNVPGPGGTGVIPIGVTAINYAQRESVPDIVGALRVDEGWGTVQFSGAYHRISSSGSTVVALTPAVGGGFVTNPLVGTGVAGSYGTVAANAWAIQEGAKLNLTAISPGDAIYVQAAYARGDLSYVNSGYTSTFTGTANTIGATTFATYDAVVGPTGRLSLTRAYSALFAFVHYWTPSVRTGLFAGAEHVGYSGPIRAAAAVAGGAACPTCLGSIALGNGAFYNPYSPFYAGGTQFNAGANLVWSPVIGLDMGFELFYLRNQMAYAQYNVNTGTGRVTKEDDSWRFRLRLQRDF